VKTTSDLTDLETYKHRKESNYKNQKEQITPGILGNHRAAKISS